MATQWRVGANGATGLDYNALPVVMRMVGIPQKDRTEIFESIRVLESAAMDTMRESQK